MRPTSQILAVLAILAAPLVAQAPQKIPITGNLGSILGTPAPYATVELDLYNCPAPVSVTGYAGIVQTSAFIQADASGNVNTNIWPNDKITCNGTTGASQYGVTYIVNGVPSAQAVCYSIASTIGTWYLNGQIAPVVCGTSPPNPTDGTYTNLTSNGFLQGNNGSFTGSLSVGTLIGTSATFSGGVTANVTGSASLNVLKSGDAMTGALTTPSLNGVLNAALYSGVDIGAKVNAAISACSSQCTVQIPTGTYSHSTTITIPASTQGKINLACPGPGTVLSYTGSGDALQVANAAASGSNISIIGCRFDGASSGAGSNGVHFGTNNGGVLDNVVISNFKGDGFRCEGCNGVTLKTPSITGNANGVHLLSATYSSANYQANAITILGGNVSFNTGKGWWQDGSESVYGAGAGDSLHGVTLDGNGQNVEDDNGTGDGIYGGYLEYFSGSTATSNILLGTASQTVQGFTIDGAFLTSTNATNSINDVNSVGTNVQGVSEGANIASGYLYNHGTLSRKSQFGCTNLVYGSALTYVGGSDTGNDTMACNGPNAWKNSSYPTATGYGLSYLNLAHDLNMGGNATITGNVAASGFISGNAVAILGSVVIDGSSNVKAGGGGTVVYRCVTAGTLPIGALTVDTGASCGTETDTGLRVK